MTTDQRIYSGASDDFVLTISDDEAGVPNLDEEKEIEDLSAATSQNAKKRKRNGDDEVKSSRAMIGKNKKAKRNSENNISQEPEAIKFNDNEEGWGGRGEDDGAMDSDFEFQIGDIDTGVTEGFDSWGLSSTEKGRSNGGDKKAVNLDDIIARRRKKEEIATRANGTNAELERIGSDIEEDENMASEDENGFAGFEVEDDELLAEDGFGMGALGAEEEEEGDGMNSEEDSEDVGSEDKSSEDDDTAAPVSHPDDVASNEASQDEEEDPEETARREAFFAPEEKTDKSKTLNLPSSNSFQLMSLSRPILRGLASVGFSEPTPIQTKTVPVALLGKDVVGGAVTGSGKTAAFIIPILERLLYRPKKVPTSRVAILMPTRELAVQCFNVAKKLASFTDITFSQLVGGFSLREQESVLKTRPDVIIATPGRFIDHMRNSASFTVDTLEILVLDEADRMLEDGFADELNEILTTIPKSRQTMLFSATMTDSVDKLIRVGLNRPARLLIDAKRQTVGTLVQEFVRLRPGRENKRLGYLMHLCSTTYTDRVIIFFRQKREAHRVRIVFGLCALKAAELHGSMSQEQRINSVEAFRDNRVSFLLATDLASRGLDIKGVSTVINYEAPQSHEIYLHRVGRTARAGRTGRACTIAAEPDRKVVKAAVKAGRAQGAKIVSRVVEPADADAWVKKVENMEEEIEDIMREEKEEKQLSGVEMQVRRGENIITHEDEIMARPKRTWFESEKEKLAAKRTGRVELNGPEGGKKEKRKLSGKDKKRLDDRAERMDGKVWKKGKAERDGKGKVVGDKRGGKAGGSGRKSSSRGRGGRSGGNRGKGGRR
ncbi:MAG: nucleolar DEAD-box protein required for synthesis of 60S ribosomal subunit [Pycnora praestabilis]|nr:MAG: nucleolar DEAD-box protein required for synthesis of 60S ribosomal subunit [Pycnora praestabilis]